MRKSFIGLILIIILLCTSCNYSQDNASLDTPVNIPSPTAESQQIVPDNQLSNNKEEDNKTPVISRANSSDIQVIVTQDFGNELIINKKTALTGSESAIDVLRRLTELETAYGGGFVVGINGVKSEYPSEKKDWFFYINGMLSNRGGGSYTLNPGDVQRWDLRSWSSVGQVSATIADFPEPFLHGYAGNISPTTIIYADNFKTEAQMLQTQMLASGINNVSLIEYQYLSQEDKENNNLIIVGTVDLPLISELHSNYKRLGLTAYFEQNILTVLDSSGNKAREYKEDAGIIQATQNPWNPRGVGACQNVVWIISGIDNDDVISAINLLSGDNIELDNAFGMIIVDGKPIKIPWQ